MVALEVSAPLFADDGTPCETDFTPAEIAEIVAQSGYEPGLSNHRHSFPSEVVAAYTRGHWRERRDIDAMLDQKRREATDWLFPTTTTSRSSREIHAWLAKHPDE